MLNKNGFTEKRKRDRFKLRGGAFVSVKSDHYKKIGSIRDISRDGFTFRYIGKEEQICGPLEVDILYSGSGLYLRNIKSKAVADFKTDKNHQGDSLAIRQCCVQFGELTEDQTAHLESFIKKYGHRSSGKDHRQFDDPGYNDLEISTYEPQFGFQEAKA